MFGLNSNLSSVLTDKPHALEEKSTSKIVGQHIASLYEAKRVFTEADCSERIGRAIRKQIRHTETMDSTGDQVYYRRPYGLE